MMAVMKKSMMNMIVGGGDAATMNNDTKYHHRATFGILLGTKAPRLLGSPGGLAL